MACAHCRSRGNVFRSIECLIRQGYMETIGVRKRKRRRVRMRQARKIARSCGWTALQARTGLGMLWLMLQYTDTFALLHCTKQSDTFSSEMMDSTAGADSSSIQQQNQCDPSMVVTRRASSRPARSIDSRSNR